MQRETPFVGVQISPQSILDEEIEPCLDFLQKTLKVDTLLLTSHAYCAPRGRSPFVLAGDHGAEVRDERSRDLPRVWVRHHEEYFAGTILRHSRIGAEQEYATRDIFAELAEPLGRRGMRLYARFLEPSDRTVAELVPNWLKVLGLDAYGRPAALPCWNNPDYRNWLLSTVEDMFKSYQIDGLEFGSERAGPLSSLVYDLTVPACFCSHCLARGHVAGIDVKRACEGFRRLYEFVMRLGSIEPGESMRGVSDAFTRMLSHFPDVLAWEKQVYHEACEDVLRMMYGAVKVLRPEARFGIHLGHRQSTWDLVFRGLLNYQDAARHCDFVKFTVYPGIVGACLRKSVLEPLRRGFCREIPVDLLLDVSYELLGYDPAQEPAPEELDRHALSADGVGRLARRFVGGMGGQTAVYAGIGIDVPLDDAPRPSNPALVRQAVGAALDAGVSGIVAAREYDEMRAENLRAIGSAVRERCKASAAEEGSAQPA